MIQDISPKCLNNVYFPHRAAGEDDFVVCLRGQELMFRGGEGEAGFPRLREFSASPDLIYLFSVDEKGFYLALEEGMPEVAGGRYLTLRDMRYRLKGPRDTMYAAYTAWHLALWYRDSRYCGRCGHSTRPHGRERALLCPSCGNIIYPRLIPAVIAGVIHGDELLMTKYADRPMSFYALVAGFTEIGETLEECVAREVMEETGLRVKNLRYYKSQPWGSVQDLLVGFFCEVDGDPTIRMDPGELKEARWIRRRDIVGQTDDWSLTNEMMMAFRAGYRIFPEGQRNFS